MSDSVDQRCFKVRAGLIARFAVLYSVSLVLATTAIAADDQVFIRKVVRDKAILITGKQEFYLIQTSPRCRSLERYEGKTTLVHSPQGFLGPHSRLVLIDMVQQCSIMHAAGPQIHSEFSF